MKEVTQKEFKRILLNFILLNRFLEKEEYNEEVRKMGERIKENTKIFKREESIDNQSRHGAYYQLRTGISIWNLFVGYDKENEAHIVEIVG